MAGVPWSNLHAGGTRHVAPFDAAHKAARALKLLNRGEWRAWCQSGARPPMLPVNPDRTYKDSGWQGWGHWLGTGNQLNKGFPPFVEARDAALHLKLASRAEWNAWLKAGMRPAGLPSRPEQTYKDSGWQGWGHWLGTGNQSNQAKRTQFLPFDEALAVAQRLGLAGLNEWRRWCKEGRRPANMPSNPNRIYKDTGWQGWGHWLNSSNLQTKLFLPFAEALAVARSLGLASAIEWRVWSKDGGRPANVPSAPNRIYKDAGWRGWGHWLGTGNTKGNKKNFLPFDEALRAARQLRLVGEKEWKLWCRTGARPANMPAAPDKAYVHDGWVGWVHWLCHANLEPAPAPADAPAAQKRAAPSRTATPGESKGKRRRR